MHPWLFNVYMDDMVREVNARVLGKVLEWLSVNRCLFEINLLFADNTASWLTQRRRCVDWCMCLVEYTE